MSSEAPSSIGNNQSLLKQMYGRKAKRTQAMRPGNGNAARGRGLHEAPTYNTLGGHPKDPVVNRLTPSRLTPRTRPGRSMSTPGIGTAMKGSTKMKGRY